MNKLNFIDCIHSKYKYTDMFYDEMATVVNWNELCGFINKNGEEVIKCQYNSVLDFHSGLAAVKNSEGLWGYIDKEGNEVISCQFIDLKGNIGYLDDNLNEKIAPLYQRGSDFREGLTCVTDIDGKNHYIDKFGNIQFTIDTIYNGVLELDDKTIYISATSEQKFKEKKLQVLKLVKEEMINKIIDNIDNLAYDHTNGLYQYTRSKKKN